MRILYKGSPLDGLLCKSVQTHLDGLVEVLLLQSKAPFLAGDSVYLQRERLVAEWTGQ